VLTLHKILPGLQEIFGLYRTTNLSSFVVCFNVVQLILFWQNDRVFRVRLCQNLPWSKTASRCSNADYPQPNKNFPKQKNISRAQQSHVSRTTFKVNRTDTRLHLSFASWITTHIVCSICRCTSVSTGTSNKQILSTKSGTWWSQSSRHGGVWWSRIPKQCSNHP